MMRFNLTRRTTRCLVYGRGTVARLLQAGLQELPRIHKFSCDALLPNHLVKHELGERNVNLMPIGIGQAKFALKGFNGLL